MTRTVTRTPALAGYFVILYAVLSLIEKTWDNKPELHAAVQFKLGGRFSPSAYRMGK